MKARCPTKDADPGTARSSCSVLPASSQQSGCIVDDSLLQTLQATEGQTEELRGHVIIAGFGRVGQIIGQLLAERLIPFVAVDVRMDCVQVGLPLCTARRLLRGTLLCRGRLCENSPVRRVASLRMQGRSARACMRTHSRGDVTPCRARAAQVQWWHVCLQAGKALDLPVYFGDAGSSAVLHSLGAAHAACAVITLDTPGVCRAYPLRCHTMQSYTHKTPTYQRAPCQHIRTCGRIVENYRAGEP